MSDEDVLTQSLVEPAWFAVLVGRYEAPFFRKAYKVVRNREDAEDVVQETFTKIYLYATRFREVSGASFHSWAYTILLNNARTIYQKRKREQSRLVVLPAETLDILASNIPEERVSPLTLTAFSAEPLKEHLASLLTYLPSVLARVSRLAFLEGRRYRAIADEEGITVSAVKMRVYRAKKLLRELSVDKKAFYHQHDE